MPHRKRIPANDKVPFERWEMPDLTGVRKRIAQRLNELEEEQKEAGSEEAPEPKAPTPEELEALREEARNEGYTAGFEEGRQTGHEEGKALGYQEGEAQGQEAGFQSGYQQGLDQAQHEVDQQLARLQSLIEQLQGPLQNLDQEVEAGLLSLVDLISRAILRREIGISREFLADVLREAVAALPAGHQRLRIYINPEDQQLVEAIKKDLLEENRIISDPQITPGGVRVETLQSLVDCTLENRYKKVIDSLLDAGYQDVNGDLEPLSREILAEPEATPPLEPTQPEEPEEPEEVEEPPRQPDSVPEETAVDPQDYLHDKAASEPEAEPESEPEPEPEPVAKVSLQRSSAPRNLPPLDEQPPEPIAADEPAPQPEEAGETLAKEDQQEAPEPESYEEEPYKEGLNEQAEPDAESPQEDIASEQAGAEPQPPLTDEDEDDFFDQLLADEGKAEDTSDETAPAEKVWAPESVHEVRYLDDPDAVMESTWKKDFQDEEPAEGAETAEATAGNPEQALDDLLQFEENPDEDAAIKADRSDDHG